MLISDSTRSPFGCNTFNDSYSNVPAHAFLMIKTWISIALLLQQQEKVIAEYPEENKRNKLLALKEEEFFFFSSELNIRTNYQLYCCSLRKLGNESNLLIFSWLAQKAQCRIHNQLFMNGLCRYMFL